MRTKKSKVAVFKSLGNNTRLDIVRKLARDGCEVKSSEIISGCMVALDLAQPTISHHFSTLVAAGVLLERKVGVEKYYQLNVPLLERVGIDPYRL